MNALSESAIKYSSSETKERNIPVLEYHTSNFHPFQLIDRKSIEKKFVLKKKIINIFFQAFLIQKFCKNMRSLVSKLPGLHKNQRNLIGDLSFYKEGLIRLKKRTLKLQKFIKLFIKPHYCFLRNQFLFALKEIPIFDSLSNLMNFWSFCRVVILFVLLFLMPILIFIDNLFETAKYFHNIFYGLISFFLLDILTQMNTNYFKNGEIQCERKEICLRYARKNFWKDLLAVISLFTRKFCIYSLVLLYLQWGKIIREIDKIEKKHKRIIIKLSLWSLLLIHNMACFYIFIGNIGVSTKKNSWLEFEKVQHDSKFHIYFHGIIHCIQILLFNDQYNSPPCNDFEMVYNIFCKLLGISNFLYIIYSCGYFMINSFWEKSRKYENLEIIHRFLEKNQISPKKLSEIKSKLKYEIKRSDFEKIQTKENEVLLEMSHSLRSRIIEDLMDPYLKKIPCLSKNFSDETLKKIKTSFKIREFYKNETIYEKEDHEDPCLYFIKKGTVLMYFQKEGNKKQYSRTKKENEIIGKKSFFSSQPQNFTVKALSNLTLFELKQADFMRILKENTLDYEKYCYIKDKINLYNDFSDLYEPCAGCGLMNHNEIYCPVNHFIVNKRNYLGKMNFSIENKRRKFPRKAQKRKYHVFPEEKFNFDHVHNESPIPSSQSNASKELLFDISDDSLDNIYKEELIKKPKHGVFFHQFDLDKMKIQKTNYFIENHYENTIAKYNKNRKKIIKIYEDKSAFKEQMMRSFDEVDERRLKMFSEESSAFFNNKESSLILNE